MKVRALFANKANADNTEVPRDLENGGRGRWGR
jgi:hypothetical protein